MILILWTVAALAVGLLAIYIMTRLAMRSRPPLKLPPGEHLPDTRLQRSARRCLLVGSLLSLAAAGVVVAKGPATFYADDTVRLTVTGLLLGSIAVLGFFSIRVRGWVDREDGALDERDRAIFGRAPAAQTVATILTLAVWIIGLREAFSSTGLVPVVYLYLVFWSCIIVSLLALPIGVLIGYRRD